MSCSVFIFSELRGEVIVRFVDICGMTNMNFRETQEKVVRSLFNQS
jgi:hypothetical protein